MTMEVRQARAEDHEDVVAFTSDTWSDRFDRGDYIPEVFPEWVETDGPDQHTVVAEAEDGRAIGVCQVVALSAHETWAQGMRVADDARAKGVAEAMNDACFAWARDRGATVCRNMVFSWNAPGLGAARGVGYDPAAEFRWAHPDPDADARADANGAGGLEAISDPDAAWSYWQRSDAAEELVGLTLDPAESWALSEATRERFRTAADERRAFAVQGNDGTHGAAVRTREYERESGGDDGDGASERWVEYGVGAWDDVHAAQTLFAALARDAADLGADRTRVLIPETPRHVSDAAYAGIAVSENPDFVMAADLTGTD
ncbi:GCN5-like N-acetyltransferase [Halosimplex carlsbadense 2-9-1]|uniref:GCN5-like N-acetyltransferase n=1 Tax=Halosimplex carlsbadense 2-9-1 TaxID=797114 RepID=M0D089_9EURY|nr:GNAT family N-acetyltransferase [Halosimplex carlsbadense]ELZ28880.1 GCN5-like N-acetyltransferase [Halosimplex carlsbadense 2-9-1]